jgi:2-polyprenyl-3-methyl-5-hydroxy-6-metoxy-1,4-benzoquinol methylase
MKIWMKLRRIYHILINLELSSETPLRLYLAESKVQLADSKAQLAELELKTEEISKLDVLRRELEYEFLRYSDVSKLLLESKRIDWFVECEQSVALTSQDHIHPRGVRSDETRSPAFVHAVLSHFGKSIDYLDFGAAGGGLVYDFILENCHAIGIEGSDYALKKQRAYWREIPWALHTADLTKKIKIYKSNSPSKFDVIGAWEFFEHISERDIPQVLNNVRTHLKDSNSLLLANIASFHDSGDGFHWHQTVQDQQWWKNIFEENGFILIDYPFDQEFNPRGTGNSLGTWGGDYDLSKNPDLGFSIAAKLKNGI